MPRAKSSEGSPVTPRFQPVEAHGFDVIPTFHSFNRTDYRYVHRVAPTELRSADAEAEDATRW